MSGQPGRVVDVMDVRHLGRPRDSGDPELWRISREAVGLLTGAELTGS